ncbi:MAG TPA: transglutaminase-like domain-containing protein [Sphingomicrobium sp.]|nr:transglutaminase-like domain-containing protein [Sphingomicrobium sp.]
MSLDVAAIGLIEDEDILLDIAALALSHLDHEHSDIERYLELLDQIEERVCGEGRSSFLSSERAAVLSRVLHDELGFVGDAQAYDAPINADFIRVLDRRRGLPISLSVLYVAMARRAGWSAYVLNLPGTVLVQLGEDNPVVIDPFAGGALVSQATIAGICRACLGEEGDASSLSIVRMSNREVLTRLLNNQAVRAEDENDALRALAMYRRITLVAPELPDGWRNLARLQLELNDVAGARASLLAMSEVAPEKEARDRIMDAFEALDPTGSG